MQSINSLYFLSRKRLKNWCLTPTPVSSEKNVNSLQDKKSYECTGGIQDFAEGDHLICYIYLYIYICDFKGGTTALICQCSCFLESHGSMSPFSIVSMLEPIGDTYASSPLSDIYNCIVIYTTCPSIQITCNLSRTCIKCPCLAICSPAVKTSWHIGQAPNICTQRGVHVILQYKLLAAILSAVWSVIQ